MKALGHSSGRKICLEDQDFGRQVGMDFEDTYCWYLSR